MTKIHELTSLGQSIWYDNISRALLDSGEFTRLLEAGVVGVTSNPTIFEKAIGKTADYDSAIGQLSDESLSDEAVYEHLAVEDIKRAAELLEPVYRASKKLDGYISLEVSPSLAHDTDGTVAAAQRLWNWVDKKNVMIKVPATPAGIPAIKTLIGEGINVNVTLLFSIEAYEAVAQAYIEGLEEHQKHCKLNHVASVASFFISRVDTLADKKLTEAGNSDLLGKIGLANAKVAYASFQQLFSGERWEKLAEAGAMVQRPLWASTGTKNPNYPDTLYIDQLIGSHTVNTVPPTTLDHFLDHGQVTETLVNLDEAKTQIGSLSAAGVDMKAITDQLLDEGVASFAKSFDSLLASVAEKRAKLAQWDMVLSATLGDLKADLNNAAAEMRDANIMGRIWDIDHTVWQEDPTEVANRLGWLHSPKLMQESIGRINELRDSVIADGFTDVILMGMGGSSLAPEVFMNVFGGEGLTLHVLDSTDGNRVLEFEDKVDLSKTLYIVATKSGGTAETLSFFKYFYNKTVTQVGQKAAGAHFIAITDPGSKLEAMAAEHDFRETYLNDPNIGGRYAALSFFGMVPAGLVGVDLEKLLARAQEAAENSHGDNCPTKGKNISALIGAIMGEAAKKGKDKITLVTSPALKNFGDWVEQLIAESTGKNGEGILPVTGETLGAPEVYGNDRLFAYIRIEKDHTHDNAVQALLAAGHPVIMVRLRDIYDIAHQFFFWEMATVVAGYRLGIQPFDQPNVESAKIIARQMIDEYMEKGVLPASSTSPISQDYLTEFMATAKPGDYVSIQAYVHPTAETDTLLDNLRIQLRDKYQLATTVGYGPRFLHSTGQLHKGDGGNGMFIQFVSNGPRDADIPDEAGSDISTMSFNVLKNAQALGDAAALEAVNRRLIRFDLGNDVVSALQILAS
ncbi:MAG: transaldolase/glucose-6-phosphate isomerase [Cellvibrionaceae bacterium]|jgi:transaldolase/glucose-6-phosphate isomerase